MSKRKAEGVHGFPDRSIRRRMVDAPHGFEAIKIIVGTGLAAKRFDIHLELLIQHSDYFQQALRNHKEANKQRVIELTETDPEFFVVFKNFIYEGKIYSQGDDDMHEMIGGARARPADREWDRLCNCWLLGEHLVSTSFKDAIVDAIQAKMKEEECYPLDIHRAIYAKGSCSSRLRNLLVDIAVWEWDIDSIEGCRQWAAESRFMIDVAIALKERLDSDQPQESPFAHQEPCHYHEHVSEGKPCYTTMFRSSNLFS